jgi:lysophospholipase L1-like esterase
MKTSLKRFAVALCAVMLVASFTVLFFETQRATASTVRVACVGDSITRDTEYPDALSSMLGANYTVGNFGVGRTTVSLQFNKPYMNQQAFQDAQRFNPDIVVIMLGTNDAYLSEQQRSNFVNDYKALINSFNSLPSNPKVYIVVPPPVFNNTMGLPAPVLDDEVIPLVNQTATDLNLPTIDVHTPLLDNPEDFQDGVHPNTGGSEVMASEIYNAIT